MINVKSYLSTLSMSKNVDELEQAWRSRLSRDDIRLNQPEQESIIKWLLGQKREYWDSLTQSQLTIAQKGLNYRYQILRQRYLNVNPTQSYSNLLNRLGSLVTLRQKIRAWISLSRDRKRAVVDVLQEVIQEMLNSDNYMKQQMSWINCCTFDKRLRDCLLLASLEEYCLRPIRNQPLLVYRFVNFLKSQSKSGITQVPQAEMIRILSEEMGTEETENAVSLFDTQAIALYQDTQVWQETQTLRLKVQQVFEAYLAARVGQEAVEWLQLYLAGRSQEAIAQALNMPIDQVYRLREKVGYHAIRVFALKEERQLVEDWLKITLGEHNFGLTSKQWTSFWEKLTPLQQEIFNLLKVGQTLEDIAQSLNLKKTQVKKEWTQIYLLAQRIRNAERD